MDQRLSEAARAGDREALLELLREDPLLLDRATTMDDYASDTPLHVSAMLGHVDFARELLRLKPSLARARDRHGFGPLHLASAAGHAHVVMELLAVDGGSCDLKDRRKVSNDCHQVIVEDGLPGDEVLVVMVSVKAVAMSREEDHPCYASTAGDPRHGTRYTVAVHH
ncbi:hypothetical protein QJS10_CPB20g00644 [Acorus calamus]|uniref:Uncharacterized protein n=1 Tax=Acorus calamus TaxID=4465 RepID=A0AAV9CC26_ACOCL|nr:hypothetical protein QJS10_CPB20g00644 [Acorus calamus]